MARHILVLVKGFNHGHDGHLALKTMRAGEPDSEFWVVPVNDLKEVLVEPHFVSVNNKVLSTVPLAPALLSDPQLVGNWDNLWVELLEFDGGSLYADEVVPLDQATLFFTSEFTQDLCTEFPGEYAYCAIWDRHQIGNTTHDSGLFSIHCEGVYSASIRGALFLNGKLVQCQRVSVS